VGAVAESGPVPFDAERELDELRAYLGPSYDHARLQRYAQEVEEEYRRLGDEERFYRTSEAYLYDLTAFAMSGTKLPYLRDLTRFVPRGGRVLDYGCGIGSDGLLLLEAGYQVAFADFDNPSTRYLRWRLERRGLRAPIYDLDRDRLPAEHDLVYAFDVIEHVPDPFGLLARIEQLGRLVLVNFLESVADDTELHRPLPVARLVARAADRSLLHYRRYHGRSHLVLYEPGRTGARRRLRSRVALWSGRLRVGSVSPRRSEAARDGARSSLALAPVA
jgi:SAM-dependent methyltransferase